MEFEALFFTKENEIEKVIRDHWIMIDNFTINANGTIDVAGNVKVSADYLTELPLRFNKVSGDFDCSKLSLISLKGAPTEVGRVFNCSFNQLASLEYLPKKAGCVIFDNTVKSLYTGGLNCNFERVVLNHITDQPNQIFKEEIIQNSLNVIFKYQNYYGVWRDDNTMDSVAFAELINDVVQGLE